MKLSSKTILAKFRKLNSITEYPPWLLDMEAAAKLKYFNLTSVKYVNINKEGRLHCESGPAIVIADGPEFWCKNGLVHRGGAPAIGRGALYSHYELWCQNGLIHRADGPAFISNDNKHWFKNGLLHREDGPAREYWNGTKEWFVNGLCHREDGPAVESKSIVSYYLFGQYISRKRFTKKFIRQMKMTRIIET